MLFAIDVLGISWHFMFFLALLMLFYLILICLLIGERRENLLFGVSFSDDGDLFNQWFLIHVLSDHDLRFAVF